MNKLSGAVPAKGEAGAGWVKVRTKLGRRLCSLDRTRLYAAARRRTGLEDFGQPPTEPALGRLLDSLETEADLRLLGRFILRIHLRELLETRLRLAAAWKKNRTALETEPIEKPVFIVGMPRSGSTFLHELLAENPQCRAPRVWEVMFPVAGDGPPRRDQARRIRQAQACLWWFRRLAPLADRVYPMRALTPHECVAIHSYTFLSEEFVSTCRIPAYEAFLRHTDLTPAYFWQKSFLQHLQWQRPARRWILKSPDHVYGLDALFSVFPDAQIIQTHRDPLEVLRSSADLTRVLHGLYGPAGELEQVLARESAVLAANTERLMQFRNTHPGLAGRFIDVRYTDLVANPPGTVRSICAQTAIPFPTQAAERARRLAARRSRYRGCRSKTEPLKANLARVLQPDRFARYCERFGLGRANAALRR